MPISPAAADRGRRLDRDLDAERARIGSDRNIQAADQQLEPSHGDKSLGLPNTNQRKVAGR